MRFYFPTWTNRLVPLIAMGALAGGLYLAAVIYAATEPSTLNLGYQPKQPVPFSHKLHAGKLRMDCRYCHNTVDRAAHAAIPATSTCVNCHSGADTQGNTSITAIRTNSVSLAPVHRSQNSGEPIRWTKVHDLPDYVYFDHSAHVNRGVSCISCHGRVDKMDVVEQVKTLSMTFCLDCHRDPEPHLRPLESITDLAWTPARPRREVGAEVKARLGINPKTNCSTCHR